MAVDRKRVTLWLLAAILIAGSVVLLLFRHEALAALGRALVRSDPPKRADLIYVLAGDFWGNRVLVGAELGARALFSLIILGSPGTLVMARTA